MSLCFIVCLTGQAKTTMLIFSEKAFDTDLQVWCLGLIYDKPHQNVKLLIKWKRIPVQRKQRQKYDATNFQD